ncbi:MAG: response regulator [Planctomycetia bacterium]
MGPFVAHAAPIVPEAAAVVSPEPEPAPAVATGVSAAPVAAPVVEAVTAPVSHDWTMGPFVAHAAAIVPEPAGVVEPAAAPISQDLSLSPLEAPVAAAMPVVEPAPAVDSAPVLGSAPLLHDVTVVDSMTIAEPPKVAVASLPAVDAGPLEPPAVAPIGEAAVGFVADLPVLPPPSSSAPTVSPSISALSPAMAAILAKASRVGPRDAPPTPPAPALEFDNGETFPGDPYSGETFPGDPFDDSQPAEPYAAPPVSSKPFASMSGSVPESPASGLPGWETVIPTPPAANPAYDGFAAAFASTGAVDSVAAVPSMDVPPPVEGDSLFDLPDTNAAAAPVAPSYAEAYGRDSDQDDDDGGSILDMVEPGRGGYGARPGAGDTMVVGQGAPVAISPVAAEVKTTILVVDDSPTVCKLVSVTLKNQGYRVMTAGDGVEAMSTIKSTTPDLILLDITMPRMDGYELCKLLKGYQATKRIPIIMLSGKDGLFNRMRGKMAGCTDYITKPFDPDTLLGAVKRYAPKK